MLSLWRPAQEEHAQQPTTQLWILRARSRVAWPRRMQKAIKANLNKSTADTGAHQKIYLSTRYNGQLPHASALAAAAAPHARRQPSSSVNSSRKMRRQPGFFVFGGVGAPRWRPAKGFGFAQQGRKRWSDAYVCRCFSTFYHFQNDTQFSRVVVNFLILCRIQGVVRCGKG